MTTVEFKNELKSYLINFYHWKINNNIVNQKEIAEYILKNSMKNKELLKLLSLEKGLVYFTTSLKSNEIVMERTMKGKIVKLYDEDEDILEDAIIENRQAIEMANIYRDILNGGGFGLKEARNSIQIVHKIRNSEPLGLVGDYHPFCKTISK